MKHRLFIESEGLSPEQRAELEARLSWSQPFLSYQSALDATIPCEQLDEVVELAWAAHVAFIEQSARRAQQIRGPVADAHAPALLRYLRETLHQDLPDPEYPSQIRSIAPARRVRTAHARLLRCFTRRPGAYACRTDGPHACPWTVGLSQKREDQVPEIGMFLCGLGDIIP